jgi:hypothetical protein
MQFRSLPGPIAAGLDGAGIGTRFHRRNAIAAGVGGAPPRIQQFNNPANQSHQSLRIFFNRRLLAQLRPFFIVILHVNSSPGLLRDFELRRSFVSMMACTIASRQVLSLALSVSG